MQTENLRYDYDDKFDVLYVALGDRKNSYGDDSQDGVIYLKDIDTDKLTGITILDFARNGVWENSRLCQFALVISHINHLAQ